MATSIERIEKFINRKLTDQETKTVNGMCFVRSSVLDNFLYQDISSLVSRHHKLYLGFSRTGKLKIIKRGSLAVDTVHWICARLGNSSKYQTYIPASLAVSILIREAELAYTIKSAQAGEEFPIGKHSLEAWHQAVPKHNHRRLAIFNLFSNSVLIASAGTF